MRCVDINVLGPAWPRTHEWPHCPLADGNVMVFSFLSKLFGDGLSILPPRTKCVLVPFVKEGEVGFPPPARTNTQDLPGEVKRGLQSALEYSNFLGAIVALANAGLGLGLSGGPG